MSFFVPLRKCGVYIKVGTPLENSNDESSFKLITKDYSSKKDYSESEFEVIGSSYEQFYKVKVVRSDSSMKYYNLPEKNHYHTNERITMAKSLTKEMTLAMVILSIDNLISLQIIADMYVWGKLFQAMKVFSSNVLKLGQ